MLKVKFDLLILVILFFIIFITIRKSLVISLIIGLVLANVINPNIKIKNFSNLVIGKVIDVSDKYFIIKTDSDNVVVWSKRQPKINTKVSLIGNNIKFKNSNDVFNEKIFWNSKGVSYKILNPKFKKIIYSNKKKDYIYSWFKLVFKNKKDQNTSKIYKIFQQLGLAHIIVISSFHLTFLFHLLVWFKKPIRLLILTLFCWYIGFPIAAKKALLFIFIVTIFNKITKLSAFAITAYIMIIFQPYIVYNMSFILTIVFSVIILLFSKNITKINKLYALRIVGFYITWLWTSSIYLLNFITMFFYPMIFLIYFAVLLRIEWILKLIEKLLIKLNKINFPIVIGSNLFMQIVILLIIILLIRNLSLFHKALHKIIMWLLLIIVLFKSYLKNQSFVTFLNVGQGDAAVIKLKDKTYLIDVGKKGKFENVIKPYLFKNGISKIDKIYISHKHFDHYGGLKDDFGSIIVENNPNPKIVNLNIRKWKSENDNSKVLYFNHNGKSFLFTGDISKKVENYILNKLNNKIDVLKVSHHGSNTSTSKKFIVNIKPKKAIISYGENNYGHPSQEVINTLVDYNVYIYETMKSGNIKIML